MVGFFSGKNLLTLTIKGCFRCDIFVAFLLRFQGSLAHNQCDIIGAREGTSKNKMIIKEIFEMKKLVFLCVAVVLTMTVLAGCGKQTGKEDNPADSVNEKFWMEDSQKSLNNDLSSFSTTDQNGNPVTQDIFKDKDVTMVNFWATWCGACVDEMDELQKLHEKLEARTKVNMITVCEDFDEQSALVKKILDENGCKFITIRPDDNIKNNLLRELQYYPTTIFVDKDGKIIGEPIIGVSEGDVAENYLKVINERLEQIKK